MSNDFMPSTDLGKRAWGANYKVRLAALTTTVGISALQSTAFGGVFDTFDDALTLATEPSTRTSSTILSKDVSRDAMVVMARELAAINQAFPGITPELLNDLGLTVRDTSRTSVGAPTTKPVANIERILNLGHLLRIRDESLPSSNAKAPGVAGYEVFYKVGGTEPLTVKECTYAGLATRVPFAVNFSADDANKTVWYLVRAVNGKGEWGPTSDQISGSIAA